MKQLSSIGVVAVLGACPALAASIAPVNMDALRTPLYIVEGDAFVRHNGERFNNRPLYCNQISAIVAAGEGRCCGSAATPSSIGSKMLMRW